MLSFVVAPPTHYKTCMGRHRNRRAVPRRTQPVLCATRCRGLDACYRRPCPPECLHRLSIISKSGRNQLSPVTSCSYLSGPALHPRPSNLASLVPTETGPDTLASPIHPFSSPNGLAMACWCAIKSPSRAPRHADSPSTCSTLEDPRRDGAVKTALPTSEHFGAHGRAIHTSGARGEAPRTSRG